MYPLERVRANVRTSVQQARALLQEQLANGPRPGSQIEVAAEEAEIPMRSLIVAADALGVRTQKGQ